MRRRSRVGGPVLALALLAGSASCTAPDGTGDAGDPSGHPSVQPGGAARGTTVGAEDPMVVRTRVTRVAGRVPAAARERLVTRADRIVTDYLEGLVDGSGDPYAHFTAGARRLARDSVPPRLARLRAGRGAAYLAVLAPQGRILGATARFRVPLLPERTQGPRRDPAAELAGRLLLTPTHAGWRVFGYDVTWPDGRRSRLEGPR